MKTKILLMLFSSFFLLPSGYAASFGSSYATIAKEHCTSRSSRAGEQVVIQTCPDFKGIGIRIVKDDVQQHIVLNRNNQQYPLIFKETTTKNSTHTTLGPTIEWRLNRGRTNSVVGMIMRVYVHTSANKKRSFLVVSKVTPQAMCIVGSIPPQRNQNKKARVMVDNSANMPCVSAPLPQNMILKTLVGSWVEPVPGNARKMQGFRLYADGNAESINMRTLQYQKWRVEGNNIIFTTKNIVNSWSSSEDESYTFRFCEKKLCLTAGGITQAYTKQNTTSNERYNTPHNTAHDNHRDNHNNNQGTTRPNVHQHLDIGMMIGRQYADHCSFLKPSDLRNFIYKDDKSWRFIFSSNPQKRSARMFLNNRVENLELTKIEENFYSKKLTEQYRVVGHRDILVTLKKTEANSFKSYKRYQGILTVERYGATEKIEVLGDCRL